MILSQYVMFLYVYVRELELCNSWPGIFGKGINIELVEESKNLLWFTMVCGEEVCDVYGVI